MMEKIYKLPELYAEYQEIYKKHKAAQPYTELESKVLEEEAAKETRAKQLKEEESQKKAEAELAAKKQLQAIVLKKEQDFKETLGMFRNARKFAEEMTKFVKTLIREVLVKQVL